jgi:hypothetical protein
VRDETGIKLGKSQEAPELGDRTWGWPITKQLHLTRLGKEHPMAQTVPQEVQFRLEELTLRRLDVQSSTVKQSKNLPQKRKMLG